MKEILANLVKRSPSFLEMRYHKRISQTIVATKGRVDTAHQTTVAGVGIRALIDGAWGFAATSDTSNSGLQKAIDSAQANAKVLAKMTKQKARPLAQANLAREDFVGPGFLELRNMSLADKLDQIVRTERELAGAHSLIKTATCSYREVAEEKTIVTSDGACASMQIVQPEVNLAAIAEQNGNQITTGTGACVNGSWERLYEHPSMANAVHNTASRAVDLLAAKPPEGGEQTCILAPSVVGLLCHEAVGHTVEADFVRSGSVAAGMIGKQVASPLVSMADSGCETFSGNAVANLPFDDEGVKTETTTLIQDGKLVSYLHNRESAAAFGVKPTGNARAWLYDDEPIIRMRNTYFLPGKLSLEDIIASTADGYLLEGAEGGEADSTGEFMFGCGWAWRIKDGKRTELLRKTTLSGIAFQVLKTVDAVSREFHWDLGTSYCGKGQPAKVDAGGPSIRLRLHLGG